MLTVALQERTIWTDAAVDRDAAVVRGVAVLRAVSRNGRRYSEQALQQAVQLYDGVPVYLDHGPESSPRSYRDKVGWLAAPSLDASNGIVRADLHLNPHHPATLQILWDAQHRPQALGLSHDARGHLIRTDSGELVVESLESVRSVDLVAEPATVTSLFEQAMPEQPIMDPIDALYQQLSLEALQEKRPDLLDELRQQVNQSLSEELAKWRQMAQELQAKLDELEQMRQVQAEAAEAGVEVDEALTRSLAKLGAEDRKRLLEAMRRQAASVNRLSQPAALTPPSLDAFIAALRG